ncbi:MAG: site-specific integrase [Nanoarchaeota archaeon]|nr:site-specific integrase [Nanoarchaeota archaeon]
MDVLYLIERECKRRGYSPRTISTYQACVQKFFCRVWKEPRRVTRGDIQAYVDHLVDSGAAGSTVNVYVNALRFLMQEILCKRILLRVKYSKVPKRLPVVLSKGEVVRLIDAISNPKHKLMIELMYSAGLRLSELCRLRPEDLELERCIGWVRRGKGSKDRMFIIAKRIVADIEEVTGKGWVFEGRKSRHIDIRTPQEVVKKAVKKAGLKKKDVHCHTLRHSFATHLIEDGYDILTVQQLLGHSDIRTTSVYVHVAAPRLIDVKSPYDAAYDLKL